MRLLLPTLHSPSRSTFTIISRGWSTGEIDIWRLYARSLKKTRSDGVSPVELQSLHFGGPARGCPVSRKVIFCALLYVIVLHDRLIALLGWLEPAIRTIGENPLGRNLESGERLWFRRMALEALSFFFRCASYYC